MQRSIPQVLVVYVSALLLGMGMVSFAASSAVLMETKGFTDAQYGAIFLPLVATTIIGSLVGGGLSRRVRLKWMLLAALAVYILSLSALASVAWFETAVALRALLSATAFFGLAFGLAAGPVNAFPALLFPERKDAALLALHTAIGGGLSIGPLIAGLYIRHGAWMFFPWTLVGLAAVLLLSAACLPLQFNWPLGNDSRAVTDADPLRSGILWTCVLLGILYAFAEGTFSNWSVIYLTGDRGVAPATAAFALSFFWAMLAVGRLLISAVLLRVPAVRVWLALPVLMCIAFLLLPLVRTAATGIAAFGFAGLACSAFFPLTVGAVSRRFPTRTALVSSLMTAGLMIGIGTGTYVIGSLRAAMPMARLYVFSALYPAAAFAITLILVRRLSTRGDAL